MYQFCPNKDRKWLQSETEAAKSNVNVAKQGRLEGSNSAVSLTYKVKIFVAHMVDYLQDHAHEKALSAFKTHTENMAMKPKRLKPNEEGSH